MLHIEILASWHFYKNSKKNPRNCRTTKRWNFFFWQFYNLTIDVRVVGKLLDPHSSVLLFSNPGEKILKSRKTVGKICHLLSTRIRNFFPGLETNYKLTCWSDHFSTTPTYVAKNNISMGGYSPIKRENSKAALNFMKPGSQSTTYLYNLPLYVKLIFI